MLLYQMLHSQEKDVCGYSTNEMNWIFKLRWERFKDADFQQILFHKSIRF